MNVRLRRLSPWLLLMLALQLAGAAIAIASQEWAILAVLLATSLLAPALRKPQDELDQMADALRTSDDELSHRVLHDPLTGMANRALLFDRIGHALERRDHAPIAVLFIDLDDFKAFNDTLGHSRGDEVLLEVSRRLRSVLRPSDTVARLGGDEFAVLVEDLAEPHGATSVAERILLALSRPVDLRGRRLELSASVGVAVSGGDLSDADELVRAADLAMYAAKGSGKACYRSFEPSMLAGTVERLALAADLRRAIDHNEIELHYQPVVDMSNGRLRGVEALARWTHRERGAVAPDVFIPLAEHSGLIGRITTYVLEAAADQAHAWHEAGLDLTVSVNLSVRDLQRPGLAAAVGEALHRHGVPADSLRLEITEGSVMDQPERALATLRELAAVGVGLSVDDFGTGYSSLAYLQRLPVNELKIDRSFVLRLAESSSDGEIVRSTVGLGHNLGLSIVAEGVEDESSLTFLREIGCDIAQGFFIAKPMPADSVAEWATTSTWRIPGRGVSLTS